MTATARAAAARPREAAPPPGAGLPPIEEHARALGFEGLLNYRLWCHRSGFGSGLHKDRAERAREREAARLRPRAPHQTERRREIVERLVTPRLDVEGARRLGAPVSAAGTDLDAGTLRALRDLLLQYDCYADVLHRRLISRSGRHPRLGWGLVMLASRHTEWLRPPGTWEPEPRHCPWNHGPLFRSLARHLLARYEVPRFMDSAWFEVDPEVGRRQQGWWITVAQGGSIRRADTPIHLTKRMAHVFLQAPHNAALMTNLRWAQVIGMGGDERLARAILRTRLGRRFEDDGFWSSVVLFLVNNAMMDPSWAGPVVDYVHNMKYAPRRTVGEGGGVEEGPPPQPGFTMKGRSATKLLRQVEAWHGDLNRQSYVQFQTWQPSGIRPFELEDETEELGKLRWTVQELVSSWELAAEGTALNHCVVSYSDQCADGETSIWSICARRDGADERENVLTVAVDLHQRAVTQARGKYNALPNRRPNSARLRRAAQAGYLDLLSRSDHVLRVWIDRERLRRTS